VSPRIWVKYRNLRWKWRESVMYNMDFEPASCKICEPRPRS